MNPDYKYEVQMEELENLVKTKDEETVADAADGIMRKDDDDSMHMHEIMEARLKDDEQMWLIPLDADTPGNHGMAYTFAIFVGKSYEEVKARIESL